ncbi:MAG TPA: ABC transporter ATP-binding protein [Candidatus Scybalocola faecavium]|nr:ABC transporter ATP-binding protein [Candidatus Scybalocola faecavium]
MEALFDVSHLTIGFEENGKINKVVNDISFSIAPGEILGVVGESGSGKSMTALAAMGLLPPQAHVLNGNISFEGRDILNLDKKERSFLSGNKMSMIFQEPMTSLNPVMKIGAQVGESLKLHTKLSREEIRGRVIRALADVGLSDPESLWGKYPHELSGGMRQRVMIAQAMICSPGLLIADEPTTALDVIVQGQILKLLKKLHKDRGISILFISHDLNVIREICQNVIVMYNGVIVERGRVEDVLVHPQHEYTKTLVASIPDNTTQVADKKPVLSMEHLDVFYQEDTGGFFKKKGRRRVVKDLSLQVYEGELMGIVGESGCGKSTLAKTIVGLNRDFTGKMVMDKDVHPQMVFQDPFGSLNPARKIGWILSEPLRVRGIKDKRKRREMAEEMLVNVGLDPSFYDRYPHELSGGQRQRISIGTALLMDSRLLVADEPVSALDVTVQSQILDLLLNIHKKKHLTILFISHDLNIVRHICHRVAVIYLGRIVEMADVEEIYKNPCHPYTRMLFDAALSGEKNPGEGIWGEGAKQVREPDKEEDVGQDIEDSMDTGKGCPFYPRCSCPMEQCAYKAPESVDIGTDRPHLVRCFRV